MTIESVKLNIDRAYAELDTTRKEKNVVCTKLDLCPDSDASKVLLAERVRLGVTESVLLEEIKRLKMMLGEVERVEKIANELALKTDREKIAEERKKHLPKCERCGSPSRLCDDLEQPQFRNRANGWIATSTERRTAWFYLVCTNKTCSLRWHDYLW
jgi:hypothetical protein